MMDPALAIQAVFFTALLAAASFIDMQRRAIPDSICALIALAGLITFSPAKLCGILAAAPLLIAAVCKEGSIGGGDIKLTAASGFVLGIAGGAAGLVIGLSTMLLFHAGGKVRRLLRKGMPIHKTEATALPMAPFLSVGFAVVYFF